MLNGMKQGSDQFVQTNSSYRGLSNLDPTVFALLQ